MPRRSRQYGLLSRIGCPRSTREHGGKLSALGKYLSTHLEGIWSFNQPATSPFRLKSSFVLSARKTSASSRRRIQPHRFAMLKLISNALSTSLAVVPRSPPAAVNVFDYMKWSGVRRILYLPQVIWNSGFLNISATPSIEQTRR